MTIKEKFGLGTVPPPSAEDGHTSVPEEEKGPRELVETPIQRLTWHSFAMSTLVSMGGFIFGYDTGQISGIMEMKDFLQRFGELGKDGKYSFTNVRSGLIVGLVSFVFVLISSTLVCECKIVTKLTFHISYPLVL